MKKVLVRSSIGMNGRNESKSIRFSDTIAAFKGIERNRYIYVKGKRNKYIILKALPIHENDTKNYDDGTAYVSDVVLNILDIDNVGCVEITQPPNVMIGCDPEFFIIDKSKNQLVFASDIFQEKNGSVGYDGIMGELRPAPSVCEECVTLNLWNLIKKAESLLLKRCIESGDNIKNLDFIGSSYIPLDNENGFSAGFHVHFGLPYELLSLKQRDPLKKDIISQIVKILDFYLGIPSILSESSSEIKRRYNMSIDYGKPGLFRVDCRTLEYRTPGGSMLKHPILTQGLLGISSLVMDDIIMRMSIYTRNFKNINSMTGVDLRTSYKDIIIDKNEIHKVICSPSNTEATKYLEKIANGLSKMIGFQEKKKSIEPLLGILNIGKTFDNSITRNWRSYYNGKDREESMDVLPKFA